MKLFFTAFSLLVISNCVFAQTVNVSDQDNGLIRNEASTRPAYKLGVGESIVLSPNPVPVTNLTVEIIASNVTIFSYHVYTSTGQIVEIENLSGRPDPAFFKFPDGTLPGIYIVRFDTDSGSISRKLQVI